MSKRIEDMFRSYRKKQRELELLRQRLRDMVCISSDEVIQSMIFSSPDGDHVQSSGISDKTAAIAMHYREEQKRLSRDMLEPVMAKFCAIESELRLFDYAVALLPDRLPDVVRCLVKNGDNWSDTMRELDISKRTLQRDRRRAIKELEELYKLYDMAPEVD